MKAFLESAAARWAIDPTEDEMAATIESTIVTSQPLTKENLKT